MAGCSEPQPLTRLGAGGAQGPDGAVLECGRARGACLHPPYRHWAECSAGHGCRLDHGAGACRHHRIPA